MVPVEDPFRITLNRPSLLSPPSPRGRRAGDEGYPVRIKACSRWLSVSDTIGTVTAKHEHPEGMQAVMSINTWAVVK
jgi:hypothetical protein